VVVENTLRAGERVRDGEVEFVFETIADDRPGRYVAVFRRTNVSSIPAARCDFVLI
jgi:hypothetical protein